MATKLGDEMANLQDTWNDVVQMLIMHGWEYVCAYKRQRPGMLACYRLSELTLTIHSSMVLGLVYVLMHNHSRNRAFI